MNELLGILFYLPELIGIGIITLLILFSGGRTRAKAIIFHIILLSIWLWAQLIAQVFNDNQAVVYWFTIISVIASVWMAVAYYFAMAYYMSIKLSKIVFTTISTITVLFNVAAIAGFTINSVTADITGISVDGTLIYLLQLMFTLGLFAAGLHVLYIGSKSLPARQRKGNNILFYSTLQAVAIIGAGAVFTAHIPATQALVYLSILVFCIGIFLGMFRHGLFDIKAAAVRSVAYMLSLATLGGLYYFVAYLVSIALFHGQVSSTVSLSPINILLALMLAFTFQPIKNFFDRITNRIFFRDRYNSEDFYTRLSEVLTSTTELRNLVTRASSEIAHTLKAEQAFFFLQYGSGHHLTAGTHHHNELPLKDIHDINEHIKKYGEEVIVTEIMPTDHHVKHILTSHKIAILMPLVRHGEILGFLCLGDQKSSGYTTRDVKVLTTVSDELIIAIQNALSVQEVRDINANLKQRVENATAELRTSNARLKRLDASKDEFISMASHQLRTPLTVIKGYISMVLEGDTGKITPQQREVLEHAYDSSQRMVSLIGDFLNVSRLQTGKFVLEPTTVNFTKLVSEEIDQLEDTAQTRRITLKYQEPSAVISAVADENKLRQVMMNFIDNAIFYSPGGTHVTIQLYEETDGIVFKVIDQGIGVPEAEQAKLFTKFFRAGNARKQRPDGTGIGIFMAKKVIVAHGGSIIFESREGIGSTFGFKLPLEYSPKKFD